MDKYHHQRKYRQSEMGKRKARERYPQVREYQRTERGRACLKAGWINKDAAWRGMIGRVTGDDIQALWSRFLVCARPGCQVSVNLEVDHKRSFVFGGTNSLDNLCLLCREHHREKTNAELGLRSLGDGVPQWIQDLAKIKVHRPQIDLFEY